MILSFDSNTKFSGAAIKFAGITLIAICISTLRQAVVLAAQKLTQQNGDTSC
jgi:hypothetical protein